MLKKKESDDFNPDGLGAQIFHASRWFITQVTSGMSNKEVQTSAIKKWTKQRSSNKSWPTIQGSLHLESHQKKTYVMTQMGSITREKRQRNSSLGPKVQDQETCLCNSKGFY